MNGFITESTSKITDGIGSALKLIILSVLSIFAANFLMNISGSLGNMISFILFAGLFLFFALKTLHNEMEETKKVDNALAAGIFFWQAVRLSVQLDAWGVFSANGYLYWGIAALTLVFLWKRIPTYVRIFILTLQFNWIGLIYLNSHILSSSWPRVFEIAYSLVRYLAGIGMAACLYWIVMRTTNQIERKYAALVLYFCTMLVFQLF